MLSLRSIILLTTLVFSPLSASPATVDIAMHTPGSPFGDNGSAVLRIHEDTLRSGGIDVRAGGFDVKADGIGDFVAWCLDIGTYLALPSAYNVTTTPFQSNTLSGRVQTLKKLFNTGLAGLDLSKGKNSAGFQLALWEIIYENSALNLTDGNFRATNNQHAIDVGQGLLNGLSGPVTQSHELTFFESEYTGTPGGTHRSQHLVTGAAVPLPASLVLLVAAIAGLFGLRKTRRAFA